MFKRRYVAMAVAALLAGVLSWTLADEPKKADAPKKGDAKTLDDKPQQHTSATTIDFGKTLGLPFESLVNLGSRIELARLASDPIALASAANELAVAEKVSGKKASLTADTLVKEAAELAKEREQSTELRAVGLLLKDDPAAKDLDKLADDAKKRETDEAAAFKAGERKRGISGNLTVQNTSPFTVNVYVNGRYYGWVNPYRDWTFSPPIGHGPTYNTALFARSRESSDTWGPRNVSRDVGDYNWTLNYIPR